MKVPTNTLGLLGTDMGPAYMDTKRIVPDCVFGSQDHLHQAPMGCSALPLVYTGLKPGLRSLSVPWVRVAVLGHRKHPRSSTAPEAHSLWCRHGYSLLR